MSAAGILGKAISADHVTSVGSHSARGLSRWRVQTETEEGHRCVDMTAPVSSGSKPSFTLVRISSGTACQRLDYDAVTGASYSYFADLTKSEKLGYRQAYRVCMRFIAAARPGVSPRGFTSYVNARSFAKTETEKVQYEGCGDANDRSPLSGSSLPTNF